MLGYAVDRAIDEFTHADPDEYEPESRSELLWDVLYGGYKFVLTRLPLVHYVSALEYAFEPDLGIDLARVKLYELPFWASRSSELKNFYDVSDRAFLAFFLENGFPNSRYYAARLLEIEAQYFGGPEHSPSPKELFEGYANLHFRINCGLMLGGHAYAIAVEYLDLFGDRIPSELSVLDYGCGAADPAIYLATEGADVTVVDLDTRVLELARWRFDQRNLPVTAVGASQTERPVDLPDESYDFVIMSQFLEHVRNPKPFLEMAIEHLDEGGVFYDPVGTEFTHQICGQHLKEAREVVESPAYQALHRENFEHVEGYFYEKH